MNMRENSEGVPKAVIGELRLNLLRDFWIRATIALTDTIGAKSALDVLAPYFIHHAKYTESLIKSSHVKFSTLEDIFYGFAGGNQMVNHTKVSGELRENGVLYKAMDCATKGASGVACICNCRLTSEPVLEDLHSEYGIMMNQSLSEGDPFCSWTIAKKERLYTSDLGNKIADLKPPPVDHSAAEEIAPQILGEYWSISTRAFIEAVGQDKTREILTKRALHFGEESATNISALISESENGTIKSVSRFVDFLNGVFQIKGDNVSVGSKMAEQAIFECPFSGSPPDICTQYEAFLNGLIKRIDPSCEFSYDRMMTKGEKTCHWMIRIKEEPPIGTHKDVSSTDDPFKRLANKLVDGEITEEEFSRKIKLLREHLPR